MKDRNPGAYAEVKNATYFKRLTYEGGHERCPAEPMSPHLHHIFIIDITFAHRLLGLSLKPVGEGGACLPSA